MDWAKAEKTWIGQSRKKNRWPHHESPHGGGRRRRPPPCGEGRPKAAPHDVATYLFFGFGQSMFFQLLPNPCFFSFCPYCFFSFCPIHVFSAFAPYCFFCFRPYYFKGKPGQKIHVFSASLYKHLPKDGSMTTKLCQNVAQAVLELVQERPSSPSRVPKWSKR